MTRYHNTERGQQWPDKRLVYPYRKLPKSATRTKKDMEYKGEDLVIRALRVTQRS